MKCKSCKEKIDSNTEYCGRCVLLSVQDTPVKKSQKVINKTKMVNSKNK